MAVRPRNEHYTMLLEPKGAKVYLFGSNDALMATAVEGASTVRRSAMSKEKASSSAPATKAAVTKASRTTPEKYSTDLIDPADFPGLKEMDSIESGTGFVLGGARLSKPRSD